MNRDDYVLSQLLIPKSRAIYDRVAMIRPIPDLYHYTTSAGLRGIVSTRRIWASEARYLSDKDELVYAERLIRETLLAEVSTIDADYRPWLSALATTLVRDVISHTQFYVASFCERGDLLSQWRGYAAAGYCLHFDAAMFAQIPNVHAVRVVYEPDQQRAIVLEALAAHLPELEAARETGWQAAINHVSGNLGAQLALYVPVFKNPSFFEEREWRLVANGFPNVKYRGPLRIPFVEMPLPNKFVKNLDVLPLTRVITSPISTKDDVEAAKSFVSSEGYEPSVVQQSTIPLRTGA